jgi:hypothetical protein
MPVLYPSIRIRKERIMSNVTQYHDENDDDGFQGSVTSDRLIKGTILRWNETNGWIDRDGLRPPELLLVLACKEALQCWKQKRVVDEIEPSRFRTSNS